MARKGGQAQWEEGVLSVSRSMNVPIKQLVLYEKE